MADPVAEAKVAPRAIYYVVIDGTKAKDSAAFGAGLEKRFGFRNLVGSFLPKVEDQPSGIPGDKDRLIDEAHPFLPIYVHTAGGRKVAVVEPGGKNALGTDPFWKNYSGELPDEKPNGKKDFVNAFGNTKTTFGRHTAHEKSAEFMNTFILDPTIDITPGTNPIKARIHEESKSPGIVFPFPDHLLRAELLLISSHGWLGGYMRGNFMEAMADANPESARTGRGTISKYFSIGQAAALGRGFRGPLWIVLAQCSTANSATWELWTEVFAKSKPIVRGLLAYEEASPGPSGSILISKKFFSALQQKKTIVEAWKQANSNQKFAAIVHKDALDDRIQDWRSFKPITDATTNEATGAYMGFLSSIRSGEEILKKQQPFAVQLQVRSDKGDITGPIIGPPNLHSPFAGFYAEVKYFLKIFGPSGEKLSRVDVKFIHIRRTLRKQFTCAQLFTGVKARKDAADVIPTLEPGKFAPIKIVSSSPKDDFDIEISTQTAKVILGAGAEQAHAYWWLDIEVTTSVGVKLRHEFKTIGLSL